MGLEILNFQQVGWYQYCWFTDHTKQGASEQFYKRSFFFSAYDWGVWATVVKQQRGTLFTGKKTKQPGWDFVHKDRHLLSFLSRVYWGRMDQGWYGTSFIWPVAFFPHAVLYFCPVLQSTNSFQERWQRQEGGWWQEPGGWQWGPPPASGWAPSQCWHVGTVGAGGYSVCGMQGSWKSPMNDQEELRRRLA